METTKKRQLDFLGHVLPREAIENVRLVGRIPCSAVREDHDSRIWSAQRKLSGGDFLSKKSYKGPDIVKSGSPGSSKSSLPVTRYPDDDNDYLFLK